MGRPWTDHESWELVDEASGLTGRDVGALLLHADGDELRDTRNAQLTTFVSSLMVLDAVERLGIEPSFCAGHSLGEYTALTATGALGFDEGIRLVVARAAAMHDAGEAQPGTMAAVLGLDDDHVDVVCRRSDEDVWIANYNAPGQVVIAGSPAGVTAVSADAKSLGAKKVIPLHVSGAFHTPYMSAARAHLRSAIAAAAPRDTEIPVIANVDALAHREGAEWGRLLSAQLSSPVRWKHSLLELARLGVTHYAELGPGHALTGMVKRTVQEPHALAVQTPEDLDKLLHWVSPEAPSVPTRVEGEHLFATERLVVAPVAGVFRRTPGLDDGATIEVGTVVGRIGEHDVVSPFAGELQSFIAVETERVTARQPIAWLRTL